MSSQAASNLTSCVKEENSDWGGQRAEANGKLAFCALLIHLVETDYNDDNDCVWKALINYCDDKNGSKVKWKAIK